MTWTYALFPLLGGAGILVFALVNRNPVYLLAGGVFVLGALGMGAAMVLQMRGRQREQSVDDRLRYFAHLAEVRERLTEAGDAQRRAAEHQHPEPAALTGIVDRPDRLWERRRDDDDFLALRFGRARVPGAATPRLVEAPPTSPRDPAGEAAATRLVERLGPVPDVPVALPLHRGVVALVGDPARTRPAARALLAQLAVLHAPDDVRVAVCAADPAARAAWEWAKWLPHARHPSGGGHDGTGLMLADDADGLLRLLGAELDRRRGASGAPAGQETGPVLLVVLDGPMPRPDPTAELDRAGAAVLRLVERPDDRPPRVDVTVALPASGAPGGSAAVTAAPDTVLALADRVRVDGLDVASADALARRLTPLRLSREVGATSLSTISGLPALLEVADVATFDPATTWARPRERDLLRVPLGVDADGDPVWLDLKESALSGMGPHGLAVGATGSGKSELLRTLVVGLAMTHPPSDLALVLVDFKGGATFAGLAGLPHVGGSITDLEDDPDNVDRFADALRSELRRREQLLRDSGDLTGIREHRRRRLAGADVPPMPHLLVVVDEFSELLVQQPDFIDLFVTIGRLGRSLGVHLLLATQRLEEGRLRGLDSHLSYRLALRTFSAQESRTVIGNTDAFELPPVPGSAYLKVDTTTYRRMRVATVSAPYVAPTERVVEAAPAPRVFAGFTGRGSATGGDGGRPVGLPALGIDLSDPERASTLDVAVARLRDAAEPVHQVWLPPLPEQLALGAVLPALAPEPVRGWSTPRDWPGTGALAAVLGVVDKPTEQAQEVFAVDLSGAGGHLGVIGAPQTGKSTLLRTLVLSLAGAHTPAELQVYGLDLGGGTLAGLEGLPHVGGVAGRQRPDLMRRLVAQLEALLDEREQWFAAHRVLSMAELRRARDPAGRDMGHHAPGPEMCGHADVLVLVDNWAAVRAEFEDLEPRITALAGRGLGYGLHLVITSGRWWDMRPALRDSHGTRIETQLGDASDSTFDRRVARTLPALPGRVLVAGDHKAQAALPLLVTPTGEVEDLPATAARIAGAWPGPVSPPVRLLPTHVDADEMPAPDDAEPGVAIGLREHDLRPARIDLLGGRDPHLLVVGETGSGRTAALRALVLGLCARHTPEELRVVVVDYRRTLLDVVPAEHLSLYCGSAPTAERMLAAAAAKMAERLPGPEIPLAALRARSWWSGPHMLVLVDDHELVATTHGDPLTPFLDLLPQGRDIGLHVVLARSAAGSGAALSTPVFRRLRELGGPGLVLSGSREEGALVHGVRPAPMPPGRAQLASRRAASLVQIAWTPEPGEDTVR